MWGSFGFLLSPQITETSNWKAQNAQHKVKAMISFWGEITFGGRGDLGLDLGESSGPVWVFPTRKRPEICDDSDFDADATSVREPPLSRE